jgi:hypothetical protein
VSKPLIAPPVQLSGYEGGGAVYTVVDGKRVTTPIVGRDLTRFLSVTIPQMEKSDLIDVQHTIMCQLERLERDDA